MRSNKLIFGILTTILILIKFQPSFSQENYIPGYIIDLNNNKLNGFIDYRDWEKTPERIFFKEDMKGEKIIKIPAEIREFGVSNEIYVSATVEVEIYTLDLEYDPEFKTEMNTTFLQTMIQGSKCLY